MLWHIPIGAREQQAVLRVVRTRRPHLLAVDDPVVAIEIRAGGRARQILAAAGLAEQLAPRVFAGE
ncbi:MAG: hypothetical protein V3T15_05300, partial [Pseudomonadales bacterium]